MEKQECADRLFAAKFTAGMNLRYHQALQWRWGAADKAVRIVVGILAVIGIFLAVAADKYPTEGIILAVASAVVAMILNIVPFGDLEKFHADLFRSWSDVRREAELQEIKLAHLDPKKATIEAVCERITELCSKENQLCASEPAPWPTLLAKCEQDENESHWGAGIRTSADVKREKQQRVSAQPVVEAGAVARAES
jgi:hypothetical protein